MKLSYSRLRKYTECPAAYDFNYNKRKPQLSSRPRDLGIAIHSALHDLLSLCLRDKMHGNIPIDMANHVWKLTWQAARIADFESYQEGKEIMREFVINFGDIDDHQILGLEKHFEFQCGSHKVHGYLDYVEEINNKTLHLVDYKTGFALPSIVELKYDLQPLIYLMGVTATFSWAKHILITWYYLRSGTKISLKPETLNTQEAREFIEITGNKIEQEKDWVPILNGNCPFCDYRGMCSAYAEAMRDADEGVALFPDDIFDVAHRREKVAILAKLSKRRKQDLDSILKDHLDRNGPFKHKGRQYALSSTMRRSYPVDLTSQILAEKLDLDIHEVLSHLGKADGAALKEYLKVIGIEKGRQLVADIETALDDIARKSHHTRLSSQKLLRAPHKP